MPEPPTRTPPREGVVGDGLVATKLHLPRLQPGFVPRRRLLDRLEAAPAGQLVLVCAPAGFGKTALLGDWAGQRRRAVGWLSLDEGDNDPARFWRHVVAALDRVRPGVAGEVAPLLGPPAPPSFEGLVSALINELAAQSDRVVLVLDDYHLIQAHQVHGALEFLLEHLPPGLQLVVASRTDPPLPLARLRARGRLAEVRERDLRFTAEEAAALLRGAVGPDLPEAAVGPDLPEAAVGPDLPEAAVAALTARTEGWVAGLQLAGLSLRGQADPAGFVASFSGSHRYVLDFLAEEVLDRQPEPLRAFLLETSILERLSGPLCDAVTGRPDSQALLERAERANLFLQPLDEERRWWRFHQLFADLLQARLRQQRPDRGAELHRAAAAWHEQHGPADAAVRHALAAGDAEWAARLVERHVEALYRRSEIATQQRWFSLLPAEVIRSRPRLCVAMASWANIAGRLEDVETLLDDAEHALAAAADEPFEPSVGRELSILANVPASIAQLRGELARQRGDPERATAFIRQSLAALTEGDRASHALAQWGLAMAGWQRGRLPQAERRLSGIVADPYLASLRPWYDLGHVQQAQGRLAAAQRTFGRAVEVASLAGQPLPLAGMGHVGLAGVLCERGELEAALEHTTLAVALCRQLPYAQWLVTALTGLAWVRQARGDQAGALAAIGEAEQVAPGPDAAADMLAPVRVQRARLALAQGRVPDARRWTAERGLDVEDQPSYLRKREQLVLARVLLAGNQADQALRLLERLHLLAAAQRRVGSVIEVQVLQALGLDAVGDREHALATLAEALMLAAPEGYVRVFVDEAPATATPLRKLPIGRRLGQPTTTDAVPHEYLTRLATAFERAGAPILPAAGRGGVVVPGLIEPLSARELEVLGLLAAGKPNQAIADELVITLDTVKSHVSHILGKLGVANRTQAVTRARELGLLR